MGWRGRRAPGCLARGGAAKVEAQLVNHRGPTLGYRITDGESVLAYIPDHEPALGQRLDRSATQWISGYGLARDVDLLIHDSQYTAGEYAGRVGWGHSAVEHTDDQALGDDADDADHDRRYQQHRDPDVDAVVGGHDGGVAAEHEELAVGQVDHAHHAEDDREPDADEHEAGDAVQDFQRENGREIHRARTIDRWCEAGKNGASCCLTLRIDAD